MAFQRRDIFHIPSEFGGLPEAKLVGDTEPEFKTAAEREMEIVAELGDRFHLISEDLQRIQKKLQDAQDAFDVAAGLPISRGTHTGGQRRGSKDFSSASA